MDPRRRRLSAALTACAPLPALTVGILAMRQLGVPAAAWSLNIGAAVLGLLILSVVRRLPPLEGGAARACLAVASIATILLPFASEGMLSVHRWVAIGGLRLHASAIAAPLIVLCVAAAASQRITNALAIATTCGIILALQPDAAQSVSLSAACAVVLARSLWARPRQALLCITVLLAVSVASFVRRDALPPVAHVEGIFDVLAARGFGWAAMALLALLLLPAPFLTAWWRHRRGTPLALGVYVGMTVLAPAWGTFPVPIMGYGASPILGYFLALAIGLGGPSQFEERPRDRSSMFSSA